MECNEKSTIVIETVKKAVLSMMNTGKYADCKFDILLDNATAFRTVIEFNNCIGEIIVDSPDFAPYRNVKIEILSKKSTNFEHVFVWFDNEQDSIDDIFCQVVKAVDIGQKY